MNRLFTMDLQDYDPHAPHFKRPSARAIIWMNPGELALVYSERFHYYKFPGGGIRQGECPVDALIREVKEEVGLTVIRDTVREFGSVLRLQNSNQKTNTVFEQENFYYTCRTEDGISHQALDDYEAEADFRLHIVSIDEAIRTNARCVMTDTFDQIMVERDRRVLALIAAAHASEQP